MIDSNSLRLSRLLALALCLTSGAAMAQGTSVLLGKVVDGSDKQPLAEVVVTATSPALQGARRVKTDPNGEYRIPQLPPGEYTLSFELETFKTFSRDKISLRLDTSLRLNVELLPQALTEDFTVTGYAPTVDVGSATTGVNMDQSFIRNIAVVAPGGKGSASRSFESLAELAPGANADTYGVSLNGATSPENQYIVDGVSVNDPGFGINATPLSVEFIKEVNVISGGYLPEYGRSTGGVVNAITKSGSNEFHGSVFGNFTPGVLGALGTEILQEAGTVSGRSVLWNQGDVGAELGGPILKDKLWFYVGVAPSASRFQLERNLNAAELGPDGQPLVDERGFTRTQRIPGTRSTYFADQTSLQYLGKLTFLVNDDHNLTVSLVGTPNWSGGLGRFSLSERTGLPETERINGLPESIATLRLSSSTDTSLKWSSSFLDKKVLVDATLGWHHQELSWRASDGTRAGSSQGLAGVSRVLWQRSPPHSLLEFESLPDPSVCGTTPEEQQQRCPVLNYTTGGPGTLREATLDRFHGRLVGTLLFKALGSHVLKAGMDVERTTYQHVRAVSGRSIMYESDDGSYFLDYRQFGYLLGPDQVLIQDFQNPTSVSDSLGAFAQDSWSLFDVATLNLGVRYDVQALVGGGQLALILANQWSPRLGLIVDPTREGRSKLFANFARYFESVPLDMVDRSFPGEPGVRSRKDSRVCNPFYLDQQQGVCNTDEARLPFRDRLDPSRRWGTVGAGATIVDPAIQPQSVDELVVGGEYELLKQTRAGLMYTRRTLNFAIEDMSRDDGSTYFIGNPGYGFAKDFLKPTRDYDAVTVYLMRNFSEGWLAQLSYTWSYLRGNYEGLFRSDTGQLDPNINSDFDLVSLLPNREGPLPADRTHQIKLFGAREFNLSPDVSLNVGLSYRGNSGAPYSYLGAHVDYGPGEAFILPRGSAGRLPWVNRIDSRVALTWRLPNGLSASASLDVFNLFNFQEATLVDQNYTYAAVRPVVDGTQRDLGSLVDLDGNPASVNKNFGQPTAYQAPRSVRLGMRLAF